VSTPRPSRYTYVTWLKPILSGEGQCYFAPWFKTRNQYEKVPSDFNLASWNADHTALLNKRAAELQAQGWTVRLENQNKFTIAGKATTLGGKVDIIATKPGKLLVSDAKTGQQRNSDFHQVLIYLFAIPIAFPDLVAGRTLSGEVAYRDRVVPVGAEYFKPERRKEILDLLARLGDDTPPAPVPSGHECSFCDITATDCTVRFGEGKAVDLFTSEF
jgi:hypothetical protein